MNLNLLLGIAALGYGLYTGYVRATSPEKFGKLAAMKKQWGDRAGMIVHVVAYTIIPLIVGIVLIASSMVGGPAASD
jgi:hypothetical protein